MTDEVKPRGITNVSRVSCHLTCALQLLIHGVGPLRDALIEIARSKQGDEFLMQLGTFFDSYSSPPTKGNVNGNDENKAKNPSCLYGIMQERTLIDPNHLGDAVTAFRRILQAIHVSRTKVNIKSLSSIYETLLLGGTIRQEIVGSKGSLQRIKAKDQDMACPFSITGTFASLEEGLELATVSPRPIKGYNWDEATNYEESTIAIAPTIENGETVSEDWETHKVGRFVSLPRHILLHLQRFSHQTNGTVTPINKVVHVPLALDMANYCCEDGNQEGIVQDYTLRGAILHVLDKDDNEEEDDEGGHYISVVCVQNSWYLLDDETVIMLPDDSLEVLHWLSGNSSPTVESYVSKEGSYSTVLLLYRRVDQKTENEELHQLFGNLQVELKAMQEKEHQSNSSLVGKRLRVRWNKGKYYAGVVIGYNSTIGKHTVQYDDGDVKEYNLKKKTVEWLA